MAVSIQKQRASRHSMELVEKPAIRKENRDEFGRYLPGTSGNYSGRPKRDEASIIAQRVIEENSVAIVEALAKKVKAGDVGAFLGLAERAYGKLPQTAIHTGDIDVNVSAKRTRLAEVLALLGDAS